MASETAAEIRAVNIRYHDVAARRYDGKWGIDFGEPGRRQVLMKVGKALGRRPERFERSLEIGAGTGYFSLNLLQMGVVGAATCNDISPGMLEALRANAERLGLDVETVCGDAETLPFEDESFDLVFGHAVLHHIPNLAAAMGEFRRVLRPGGTIAFAGEPSRYGDRLAAVPKQAAVAAAPLWRRLLRAGPAPHVHGDLDEEDMLEPHVDVHAFSPADLRGVARAAGFEAIRIQGEELLASWFGWANRTMESTAREEDVPMLWRQYAYRGYLALQRVDGALLEPRLPPALFYNLMLSARAPSA